MHELRIVRRGRRRLIPVAEITRLDGVQRSPYARRRVAVHEKGAADEPREAAGHRVRDRGPATPGTVRRSTGGKCNCTPSYRAVAWSQRDKRLVRKTFSSEAGRDPLARGRARRPSPRRCLSRRARPGCRTSARRGRRRRTGGGIRNRSGDRYKPSTLRGLRAGTEGIRAIRRSAPRSSKMFAPVTFSASSTSWSAAAWARRPSATHCSRSERSVAVRSARATSTPTRRPASRSPPSGAGAHGS